jgi:hypothetical protein
MYRKILSSVFLQQFAFLIAVLFLARFAAAQFEPALPPIADPADARFRGAKEDWTSPSLSTSHLMPAQPLILDISTDPGISAQLIQVQWRWGDPLDLYVVKPKGVKNPPVILYLYSYPSETDTFKNAAWQRAVTEDGFAAVGFMTALTGHRYHDRSVNEWFVSELQECLAVSAHDVQMVLNYLATRGDLDMDRLGMVAEGSGASVGILASAVDPRIKALDVLDPWGDWPTWMATSPFVPEDTRRRETMASQFSIISRWTGFTRSCGVCLISPGRPGWRQGAPAPAHRPKWPHIPNRGWPEFLGELTESSPETGLPQAR